jgi:hypothetical protein
MPSSVAISVHLAYMRIAFSSTGVGAVNDFFIIFRDTANDYELMRHVLTEIDHMRLEAADSDHVRAKFQSFGFYLFRHCRWIANLQPG